MVTVTRKTAFLDSYCWFEYFFGTKAGEAVRKIVQSDGEIMVSAINIFEIRRKYLQNAPDEEGEKISFIKTRCKVANIDFETAALAASLSAKHKLHATDAMIYACAQANDCILYSGDSHFRGLSGVELV